MDLNPCSSDIANVMDGIAVPCSAGCRAVMRHNLLTCDYKKHTVNAAYQDSKP